MRRTDFKPTIFRHSILNHALITTLNSTQQCHHFCFRDFLSLRAKNFLSFFSFTAAFSPLPSPLPPAHFKLEKNDVKLFANKTNQ
jgi:hypothetical protein